MADLNGTWLGTYWQGETPTRFEATLIQSGNTLTGNILDDNYLGEALLSGEVVGRSVSFTKRYLTGNYPVINYAGTVNEDGDFIQGEWQVSKSYSGLWEARRTGSSLMLELQKITGAREPVGVG